MRKDREKPSASRLTVDLAMTWKRPLCYLTGFEPAFHQAMVLFQLSNRQQFKTFPLIVCWL